MVLLTYSKVVRPSVVSILTASAESIRYMETICSLFVSEVKRHSFRLTVCSQQDMIFYSPLIKLRASFKYFLKTIFTEAIKLFVMTLI